MARRKGPRSERKWEREKARERAWEEFRPRLAGLQSRADALRLISEPPPPDSPGRRCYSNLAFFLDGYVVPAGASYEEIELYLQLVVRMAAAGEMDAATRHRAEDALKRAMGAQGGL